MLGSLRKWSHSSHSIWFLNNKPRQVNYFQVTFCSILAQARLGQQILSPKKHDMSRACIFTSLCIAMATIVLIMDSQKVSCISDGAQLSLWTELWLATGEKLCILVFLPVCFLFSALAAGFLCSACELGGAAGSWRTEAWREMEWPSCLRGSLAPCWFGCLGVVLSLKNCSRLPSKPLEICGFGKGWCEVMSDNRPWQCSRLCWRGQTRSSTSAVHMKICKADPHLHPAVGNKYVCVVGCRSGVAFFTVARALFKSLVQRGV